MGLSILKFDFGGDTDFDLNFALGYASKSDIDCYVNGEFPINVEFDWLTDSRVRIDTTNVQTGDEVVFTRTVNKSELPIDLTIDGNLTRENVETAVLHAVYAQHELLDGRFGDVVDASDLVFATVEAAVTNALRAFIFRSALKKDLVLHPSFTEDATETYTSGGAFFNAEDVEVHLLTNPAVTTEFLIYNAGQVVFSVTFDSDGVELSRSTGQADLVSGSISSGVTGDNFVSGADLWIVIPTNTQAEVDFETEVTDFVELFNEEIAP